MYLTSLMINLTPVTVVKDGTQQFKTLHVVSARPEDDPEGGTPTVLYKRGNTSGAPHYKLSDSGRVVEDILRDASQFRETSWQVQDDGSLPQEALDSLVESLAEGWRLATPAEEEGRRRRMANSGAAAEELDALRDQRALARLKRRGLVPSEAAPATPAAPAAKPRYDRWTAAALKEELVAWGVDASGSKEELVARCEAGPPPKPAHTTKAPEVSAEVVQELESRIRGLEDGIAAILAKLG